MLEIDNLIFETGTQKRKAAGAETGVRARTRECCDHKLKRSEDKRQEEESDIIRRIKDKEEMRASSGTEAWREVIRTCMTPPVTGP